MVCPMPGWLDACTFTGTLCSRVVQDIVEFTSLSKRCEAEDIMNMLHTLFSRFDTDSQAWHIQSGDHR
jgi:hypothetical protein